MIKYKSYHSYFQESDDQTVNRVQWWHPSEITLSASLTIPYKSQTNQPIDILDHNNSYSVKADSKCISVWFTLYRKIIRNSGSKEPESLTKRIKNNVVISSDHLNNKNYHLKKCLSLYGKKKWSIFLLPNQSYFLPPPNILLKKWIFLIFIAFTALQFQHYRKYDNRAMAMSTTSVLLECAKWVQAPGKTVC